MTRDQLHIAFKITMDKNATNVAFGSYPAFLPEEIDYWINQSTYQVISNKFTGSNALKQPFEKSVKRIHDLEKLIENTDVSGELESGNVVRIKNVFTNKMFFIDGILKFDDKSANIDLVEHVTAKNFLQTYDNLPWIETPVAVIEGDDLVVYIDPLSMRTSAPTYQANITYVKFPTPIEEVEGNVTEFPEYMQYEIIDRAVLLALENIESRRVQTKSQLNQIDE